jgi:hypothetical protein
MLCRGIKAGIRCLLKTWDQNIGHNICLDSCFYSQDCCGTSRKISVLNTRECSEVHQAKAISLGLRGSTGAVMAQRVGGLFASRVVVNERAS